MAHKKPDPIVRHLADLNGSIAVLGEKMDDLKSVINTTFEKQSALIEETSRTTAARISTLGNQVSYFRETVCSSLKDMVSGTED